MGKPLVTFVLTSYNHERYVREAMRSALAQTYSPLQVVVSDDCSRDGTFEALREEAAGYGGPHRVVLNRNERNLGIGGNINRVMELAEGELVVQADGDDVSLPTRAEELARVWSGGGVSCVYSDYVVIDGDGVCGEPAAVPSPAESWQELVRSGDPPVPGCAYSWDRAAFDTFGRLPNSGDDLHEDFAIPFRCALLGRIAYVNKPLVKWRRHQANTSQRYDDQAQMELDQVVKYQAAAARRHGRDGESWLRDLQLFSSLRPEAGAEVAQAMETIAARIAFYEFKAQALEGAGRMERLRRCLDAARRVRKLGVKPAAKVGLLGASPRTYCRLQQRWYRKLTARRKAQNHG